MKHDLLKIILIFFLFPASPLAFKAAADAYLASGISLRSDTSGKDADYLKRIIRQLDRYAGAAGIKPSKEHITIICGDVEKFGMRGRRILAFPGDSLMWRSDFISRRRIYGLLAAHRFNFRYPENSQGLAEWIVNGMDAELLTVDTAGKYTSSNRKYFMLAEAAGEESNIPDFVVMTRLGRADDPFFRSFLAEHARLLLNLLAENGKIKEVFQSSCSGDAPDNFLRDYPSLQDAQQKLSGSAAKLIWDRYQPLSPNAALKELENILQIHIPELDENSVPTGNFIPCTWQKLAELSAERPDLRKNLNLFAGKFAALGKMLGFEEARLCNDLAFFARRFDSEKSAADNFSERLRKLRQQFERRQQINRFFHDSLDRHTPLHGRFGPVFDAIKDTGDAMTGAEKKFFRETVKLYNY